MTPISYHAMRMAWCRAALWAFLRRWAVYLIVGLTVLTLGMAGGPAAMASTAQALCAWLVLPLFVAVNEPLWIVPATVMQALVGASLVWGLRPPLWPVRWEISERSLPIARSEFLRSDAQVVALALLPFVVPCLIGARALVAGQPDWLHPPRSLAALGTAIGASWGLGVLLLQWLRQHNPGQLAGSLIAAITPVQSLSATDPAPRQARPVARMRWPHALLWLPLRRGPATRSRFWLLLGAVVLCAPSAAVWRWPAAAGWWFAVYAAGALLIVTHLGHLLQAELSPLLRAALQLPITPSRPRRGLEAAALSPLIVSSALLMAIGSLQPNVRGAMLTAYLVVCWGSCWVELTSAPAKAAVKSSRWLFCLALLFALASEIMA